jgi:hypothetical protein
MHHAEAPPRTASWLAYAGLLPFVLGALLAWLIGRADDLAPHAFVVDALSRYGAVIVSFMAALHWGCGHAAAGAGRGRFLARRGDGLLAWVAALMPAYAGLVLLGVLLLVQYGLDRRHYPLWQREGWLTLRFRCTLGAALCCFLAAGAT